MPTRRFSTMSSRPKPRLPAIRPSLAMSGSGSSDSPSSEVGTPASKPTITSTVSVSVGRVSV
jgi:hypothetical protein